MDGPDYGSLASFRFHLRSFLRASEEAARAVGLQPQQYQLLLATRGLEQAGTAPSIKQLASQLQIKHHSTVELVDRLEAAGLISRRRSSDDLREVEVELTDKGSGTLERLAEFHQRQLRVMAPDLIAALEGILRGEAASRKGSSDPP